MMACMTTKARYGTFKSDYDIQGKSVVTDDYGAQSYEFVSRGTVHTMFVPVSDEATIEEYGENINDMLQAVIYDTTPIFHYDELTINGERYEVVKIEVWMTHRRITVKKVTNGNA